MERRLHGRTPWPMAEAGSAASLPRSREIGIDTPMALFGLSPSPTVNDPVLGTLTRSRGFWRGRVMLGNADLPLLIAGGNEAPDVMALALARELPVRYLALQDL